MMKISQSANELFAVEALSDALSLNLLRPPEALLWLEALGMEVVVT